MDNDSGQGFTIIEVVLVLAIAGLIFLMVFVALPALQRSQRDTQRRNDMSRVATALTQYQASNNGKIPGENLGASECFGSMNPSTYTYNGYDTGGTEACYFIAKYLNSASATTNEFVDPDGTDYMMLIYNNTDYATNTSIKRPQAFDHYIYIYGSAKCDNESFKQSPNKRDYAILYKLEGTGTYCIDNQ